MPQTSQFTRGYNSFSGVDIKAVIAGKAIGSLQGISYSVSREKAPIYTMGSADPRAFGRGKRGIAGSLVFIQFSAEPLMDELANPNNDPLTFISDIDDLRPDFTIDQQSLLTETIVTPVGVTSVNAPGVAAGAQESNLTTVTSDQQGAVPWYPDQLPPFDIVLSAANEYGALSVMKVLGVELMNSGFGVSIDDIVCEHSYTFIATGLIPWRDLGRHPDAQF